MSLRPTYEHPRARDYRRQGGPWDVAPLDDLLRAARLPGDQPVLVDGDVRLDARRLETWVAALAGGLRAAGVRRRDVVAWQLPNWYEAVILYRACWRLGAVAAPIHHHAGPGEVGAMLDAVEPRVVLAGPDLPLRDVEGAVGVRGAGAGFHRLLGEPVTASAGRASDLAVVLFTAGSTGGPKAVLHTQRGLAYKGRLMGRVHSLTRGDAVLMPAPLAHVSGLLNGVLVPGLRPMRSVLMDRWDTGRALRLVEREQITFMVGPPTFFTGLMGAGDLTPERVSSLRLVSSGGAGVSPAFVQRASATLDCRVKRTYGSTEAPTVATSRPRDPEEAARTTDGRSTGDAELRVVDPTTGRDRPPGEPGELWLRGPELFVGYADPAPTRAALTKGWFRTGDLATLDGDGWVTIVGRLKDVIIRGGENVAAAEVEAVLEAHPAVRQAVAVGVPDERLGERVCAFVVSGDSFDLEACRAWFEARGVARFKTPERVVRLDELPTLAAGKVDRAALRRLAARRS